MVRFITWDGREIWMEWGKYDIGDFREAIRHGTKPLPYSVWEAMQEWKYWKARDFHFNRRWDNENCGVKEGIHPDPAEGPYYRTDKEMNEFLYWTDEKSVYAHALLRVYRKLWDGYSLNACWRDAEALRRRWRYDKELKEHSWVWRFFYMCFRDYF